MSDLQWSENSALRAKPLLHIELCGLELNATSRGTCAEEWQHCGLGLRSSSAFQMTLTGTTVNYWKVKGLGGCRITAAVGTSCEGFCECHNCVLARACQVDLLARVSATTHSDTFSLVVLHSVLGSGDTPCFSQDGRNYTNEWGW